MPLAGKKYNMALLSFDAASYCKQPQAASESVSIKEKLLFPQAAMQVAAAGSYGCMETRL